MSRMQILQIMWQELQLAPIHQTKNPTANPQSQHSLLMYLRGAPNLSAWHQLPQEWKKCPSDHHWKLPTRSVGQHCLISVESSWGMLEWFFILILHEFSRGVCGSSLLIKGQGRKIHISYLSIFILTCSFYIYICLAILQPESPTKTKRLEPQL